MGKWRDRFEDSEREAIVRLGAETLWSSDGEMALDYLREKRGLSEEAIKLFQIGYCPSRVDHELAGRIITPIIDPYGNIVAVSTRHLQRTKDFWHESFDKAFFLYGMNIAKSSIMIAQKAVVVEGEFDTVCLHSHRLPMTVGLCGSAFTHFHAAILGRYCQEVFIVFDSDVNLAGEKATERVLSMMSERLSTDRYLGMTFIPVELPATLDPDDYVRDFGRDSFIELLKKSKEDFLKKGSKDSWQFHKTQA
jgi:DNA primase